MKNEKCRLEPPLAKMGPPHALARDIGPSPHPVGLHCKHSNGRMPPSAPTDAQSAGTYASGSHRAVENTDIKSQGLKWWEVEMSQDIQDPRSASVAKRRAVVRREIRDEGDVEQNRMIEEALKTVIGCHELSNPQPAPLCPKERPTTD